MSKSHFNFDSAVELNTSSLPPIVDVQAVGTQIIVEVYTAQEVLGTKFTIQDDCDVGAPQGRVLSVGGCLDEKYGIKVGQRVVLQGTSVPIPKFGDGQRRKVAVEACCVKAILVEEK